MVVVRRPLRTKPLESQLQFCWAVEVGSQAPEMIETHRPQCGVGKSEQAMAQSLGILKYVVMMAQVGAF